MDYLKLKSGTDIRGVASEGVPGEPVTLTDDVITHIAAGFLCWCEAHLKKPAHALTIALGHDSRISADRITAALTAAFVRYGATVKPFGLASTPAMFMAVIDLPCDCAVQVTASHHPFHRNGLKFFTAQGGLDAPDITEILQHAQAGIQPEDTTSGAVVPVDFMKRYAEMLREKIRAGVKTDHPETPLSGLHIVVDAGNGAGGFFAHDVLAPLGADVTGSVFLEPDGRFPNHIPNPEDAAAMQAVANATIRAKGDLGVIFDTDVDRGAVVGPDGREISRNRLVALAAAIALQDAKGGTIVTDSVTSDGLKDFIETELHGHHHRFQRGYKNVINEALRLNAAGIDCPLAIETSGHAAMRENYFLDDGAYLVTKIIIQLMILKQQGKTLNDLLAPLKEPVEQQERRLSILAPDFRTAGQQVLTALEAYAKDQRWHIAPDNHEGLRVAFPKGDGNGWFLLRLSVHDPIMPLNMESNTPGGCTQIQQALLQFLKTQEDLLDLSPLLTD